MSKQRPSDDAGIVASPGRERARPGKFWRQRVFKNTYTRDGQLRTVRGWSVKIQFQARRRTFSLRGRTREAAAAEAQAIHEALLAEGWEGALRANAAPESGSSARAPAGRDDVLPKHGARYWKLRLFHRKHPAPPSGGSTAPLSARIEHDGTSFYFPLGTHDEKAGAAQAAEIYSTIVRAGWQEACRRFPRELTLAFHWAVNPVAWTYTTLYTQTGDAAAPARHDRGRPGLRIALVEPGHDLQRALEHQLSAQASVLAFACGEDALREIPRQGIQFVLVNQVLPDKAGTQFAQTLETCAPRLAVVVYSVHEDSSQLFMSTPGGASAYLLKRTPPGRILAPIGKLPDKEPLSHEYISKHVRQYFYGAALSLQSGEYPHEMNLLTPRENQILDCLSKGYVDKEIADALGISPWTVHGHIKNVFGKLDVHSRTAAVVKYLHK